MTTGHGEPPRAGSEQLEALARLWTHFAEVQFPPTSPLYAAIAARVAADPDLLDLVASAPASAHHPLALLAGVHDLVLRGAPGAPVADYERAARGEPPEAGAADRVAAYCLARRAEVVRAMSARSIQTNECGRCTLIALGLAEAAAREEGAPLAMVDAGASAGLNLRFDRYRLDFGAHGVLGDPDSPVRIETEVRSTELVLPGALPDVPVRVGLDVAPIDLRDAEAARWLVACIWPDSGRLDRTRAAVEAARPDPPDVRSGSVIGDLAPLIAEVPVGVVPVVVTSWMVSYLSVEERAQLVAQLAAAGRERPAWWLSLDGPGIVPFAGVPGVPAGLDAPNLLGLIRFGADAVEEVPLAWVQPHGRWLWWFGPSSWSGR